LTLRRGLEIEDWAFWSPEGRVPAQWLAHWQSGDASPGSASPPDGAIPAALRRRMSALSKLAVQLALEASRDAAADFLVFASQHGELGRTRELLDNIVAGVELSPAAFSHSVHNTSAGLYTIVRGSRAPASSVAAGAGTFAYGWLEAEAFLIEHPSRRALLVAYEDALPTEYRPYSKQVQCTYAAAFMLRGARERGLTLESVEPAAADDALPLAPLFAAWWQSAEPRIRLTADREGWLFARNGA
jgi:hypothetical protein